MHFKAKLVLFISSPKSPYSSSLSALVHLVRPPTARRSSTPICITPLITISMHLSASALTNCTSMRCPLCNNKNNFLLLQKKLQKFSTSQANCNVSKQAAAEVLRFHKAVLLQTARTATESQRFRAAKDNRSWCFRRSRISQS